MSGTTIVAFDRPDETRSFPHGRSDIVRIGNSTISKLELEPGWHWAEDIKPLAGTETCQIRHVGYLVSGRLSVTNQDGTTQEIGPGQTYVIEPGHDAHVDGNERMVAFEFSTEAAETFAKSGS